MSFSRLIFLLALALAVVLPVRFWVLEPIYIATASMEPTLPVGRHLFTDKITLRFRPLRREDIVVFRPPVEGEPGDLVKRVIGLPGETVEIRAKKVLINGKELEEPYVQHTRAAEHLEGDNLGPLPVPAGQLFVLGDNRDESQDSSVWRDAQGERVYFISLKDVVGLVRGVY
ncbi:MAG: signal peptidase I [Elusimicrobia bacterium]|nr:signal peptidase I [Elusimicrobiota bacterium]